MGGRITPAEPEIGSTMTAAMVDASCRAIRRSNSLARCAPQCGRTPENALWPKSSVCGRSSPAGSVGFAVIDHATDGGASEADPVIPLLTSNEPGALSFAAGTVIRNGDFQ